MIFCVCLCASGSVFVCLCVYVSVCGCVWQFLLCSKCGVAWLISVSALICQVAILNSTGGGACQFSVGGVIGVIVPGTITIDRLIAVLISTCAVAWQFSVGGVICAVVPDIIRIYKLIFFLWSTGGGAFLFSGSPFTRSRSPSRASNCFCIASMFKKISRIPWDCVQALCECICCQEWFEWRVSMCREMLTQRCTPSDAALLMRGNLEEHMLWKTPP